MELRKATKSDLEQLKILYNEAFPRSERKPFSVIEKNERSGKTEILSLYDGKFCGLVITAMYKDVALVDYFAVRRDFRGQGIGSTAIPLIRERYKNKKLFLEIERPDDNNAESQKSRRKSFYLRNGLRCADINLRLFGVPMEILSFGEDITRDDCKALYRKLYGRFYKAFIRFE